MNIYNHTIFNSFDQIAHNQKKYIDFTSNGFAATDIKNKRLTDIYESSLAFLNKDQSSNYESLQDRATKLTQLQTNEEIVYNRYCKDTKGSWLRWFFGFFTSKYSEAEKATEKLHNDLQSLLVSTIQDINRKLAPPPAPSHPRDKLNDYIHYLAKVPSGSFTHLAFKQILTKAIQEAALIQERDPAADPDSQFNGLPEDILMLLKDKEKYAILKNLLYEAPFDEQKLIAFFEGSSWYAPLMKMGISKEGGQNLQVRKAYNTEVINNRKTLENYSGKLIVKDPVQLNLILPLKGCTPSDIIIESGGELSLEAIKVLITLNKERPFSSIYFENIEKINLSELSSEEATAFLEILSKCKSNSLKELNFGSSLKGAENSLLENIPQSFPNVAHLELTGSIPAEEQIGRIALALPHLSKLHLEDCEGLSETLCDMLVKEKPLLEVTSQDGTNSAFTKSLNAQKTGRFTFDPLMHTSNEFIRYLSLRPNLESLSINGPFDLQLLKECFKACPKLKYIYLPESLTKTAKEIDLSGIPAKSLMHILMQFPSLEKIDLSSTEMTDEIIKSCQELGIFDHANYINLRGCASITASTALLFLNTSVWKVDLPEDLKWGACKASDLPLYSDPMKIANFFIRPKILRSLARDRYNGPDTYAALFQIPLARLKEPRVISPKQESLDARSSFLWTYQGDYVHIPNGNQITSVNSDGNSALNDDNLIPFISKFTKLKKLSLRGCLNISDKGIQSLLKYCGQNKIALEALDLTDCHQITEGAFNGGIPQSLKDGQFNLSGTSIKKPLTLSNKGSCRRDVRSLTITDADLPNLSSLLAKKPELISLNFFGCKNLTNDILRKVLARLNLEDGKPEKLFLVNLNIAECEQITLDAFTENEKDDHPTLMHLGTLRDIYCKGTQLDPVPMTEKYQRQDPFLNFIDSAPESLNPIPTPPPDIQAVGEQCEQNIALLDGLKQEGSQFSLNKIKNEIFEGRVLTQLFTISKQFDGIPFSPVSDEFADLTVCFLNSQDTVHIRKDILMTHSRYFNDIFSQRGVGAKSISYTPDDTSATFEAFQVVKGYLYTKSIAPHLSIKTLVQSYIYAQTFEINQLEKLLLEQMKMRFTVDCADEFLANTDTERQAVLNGYFEIWLIEKLNMTNLAVCLDLAVRYSLETLQAQITALQNIYE